MNDRFVFSYDNLRRQYAQLLEHGYTIMTCADYWTARKAGTVPSKVVVNRVDIDYSVIKAGRLRMIMDELGIKATYFLRLHAPEYNPFSFENYRVIKSLVGSGHELGLHSEIVDQAAIWNEDASFCLTRDVGILESMFGARVQGVASHGGMTGLNNLDFWADHKAEEFGLLYEAYDREPYFDLFHTSFYVSDSEWTQWKCYDRGKLVVGDRRSPAEHAVDGHELIYLLIHPDSYFDVHFYDAE